jgi:hypothetical protein
MEKLKLGNLKAEMGLRDHETTRPRDHGLRDHGLRDHETTDYGTKGGKGKSKV